MNARILGALTLVALIALAAAPAFTTARASPEATLATASAPEGAGTGLYIVQLDDPALASYAGGVPGLAATSPRATGAQKLDPRSPASQGYLAYLEGRQQAAINAVQTQIGRSLDVRFQYLAVLNGFAAALSAEEAKQISSLPGVKAVYRDTERTLETEVGPAHIGAPAIWNGNTGGGVATRGEGIVIGMIDSGINSQHPSFAGTDGDGYTHTNPYGAGVYQGWCATNPGFCNGKLIAAYGLNPGPNTDPTDTNGHGSHTASTAAGNHHLASFSVGPTGYNIPIQGVAPRANLVAYMVCNPSCPGSASIAAVNSAILNDEVDVLNYSISGSDSPWTDPVDLAFLDASNANVFVSASAGNAGPGAGTVAKTGPWNAAVGGTTHNRVIAHSLDVTGPTAPPALQGLAAVPGELSSIAADINSPIRYDGANGNGCSAFAAGFFTGSLALIERGGCTFTVKVTNAANAGATGVVVFNNVGGPPISMGGLTGTPPAVMLDLADGIALRDYVVANPTATVRINTATTYFVDNSWQDIVGGFSARGPSQFELLKPDYVAPGVNILAAVAAGATPAQYGFLQGTSMASPHGAGAAALLKGLHSSWSPAEIKSALATTARGGLLREDGATPATPFDVGSGLLTLGGAGTVGLVLHETGANYAAADPGIGGDPKTLNQPSLVDYACASTCSWTRTVRSVLPFAADYTVGTSGPAGMVITVTPASFTIPAGGTQALQISADVSALPIGSFAFGGVTLETDAQWPTPPVAAPSGTGAFPSGVPTAAVADSHLPLAVRTVIAPANILVDPLSMASTQPPNTTTQQTLTIENTGGGDLVWSLFEDATGTPGPCDNPADIPWVSASPTAGTTPPAGSTSVQVAFDSTGMTPGTYSGSLCIDSDDPDPGPGNGTDLVIVPVALTVQGTASISLAKTVGTTPGVCAATNAITVAPGTTVYYCYTVSNTGDITLPLHDLDDDQLGNIFTGFPYALTPGSSVSTVAAGLSIPFVVNAPVTNVATWTAYESSTGGVSATTAGTATVTVEDLPSVLEIPTLGAAGAALLGLALAGLGLGALRRRRG